MPGSNHFRETLTQAAEGDGKFIRQSGGIGQHGHVVVKIFPNARNAGIESIREGLNRGIVAGYPVVDLTVRVVDGSFNEADSSELAFKLAGGFALKDAMKKAAPIVLE